MKTLAVKTKSNEYNIIIGNGILKNVKDLILSVATPQKIMIVTDENVDNFYGEAVKLMLEKKAEVKKIVLPAGETTKSMEFLTKLYDEAFSFGLTRTDLVVALGGGVIGDLTGFFASTVFRGVKLVQVPTTLLSQVDSSVGGKTAIDVLQGKNLVGSFYQPSLVLIDTDTLKTLSDKEFFAGLAEVIKYGAIYDSNLFSCLEKAGTRDDLMQIIEDTVYTCCDIKRKVVEVDELDTGLRMILNFGHTAAHIIEKAYDYKGYNHGEAVAFGMVLASRVGEELHITEQGVSKRIEDIIKKFSLPANIKIKNEDISAIALDKKAQGKDINVILLEKIGKCKIHKIPVSDFCDILSKVW